MSADPVPTIAPSAQHRVAADRAIRLAHEHGAVEVADFFTRLRPVDQPIVFALMARSVVAPVPHQHAGAPAYDVDKSPWWTAAELRDAHRLWAQGHRAPWIEQGHRLYKAQHKRGQRAALKVAP